MISFSSGMGLCYFLLVTHLGDRYVASPSAVLEASVRMGPSQMVCYILWIRVFLLLDASVAKTEHTANPSRVACVGRAEGKG